LLTCKENENSDLFWAVCGCGSAFGIVIEVTMRLARLPKGGLLPASLTVHVPLGSLGLPGRAHLIARFRDFMERSENAQTFGVLVLVGGGPVVEQCVWLDGAEDSLSRAETAWKEHNQATGWFTLEKEMKAKQYHTDFNPPDDGPSVGWYLTCELSSLTDESIRILDAAADSTVSPNCKDCIIALATASPITAGFPKHRNAYFHRDAKYHLILQAGVPTSLVGEAYKQKFSEAKRWALEARQKFEAITPSIVLGAYNVADETPAVKVYGENLSRLQELKRKYDDQDLFANNANLLG